MDLRIIIIIFVVCLTTGPLSPAIAKEGAEKHDTPNEEEQEMIEMLGILENYDLVDSIEMYSNMDEIEKINDKEAGEETGGKEVEQ